MCTCMKLFVLITFSFSKCLFAVRIDQIKWDDPEGNYDGFNLGVIIRGANQYFNIRDVSIAERIRHI